MFDSWFPSDWSTLKKLLFLRMAAGGAGAWETISGISPLTLANALAHKIKSLIQYGKVSVSGTDITCNNGTLVVRNGQIVADGTPEEILVGQRGNLITGWVEDYYINASGAPTAEAGSHYTDLIPVGQGNVYVLSFVAAVDNNKRMHEYDSNGTWIRQCFYIKPAVGDNVVVAFPVGSTTRYIRWSTKTADTDVTIAEYIGLSIDKFGYYLNDSGQEVASTAYAWYSTAYPIDHSKTYYLQSTYIERNADVRVHGYTGEGLDSWDSLIYFVTMTGSNKTDYHQLEIPQDVSYIRLSGYVGVLTTLLPLPVPQGTTSATAVNLYACAGSEDTHDIITGEVIRRNNVIVYDGTQDVGERYVGEKAAGNIIIYPKETVQTGEVVTFNHDKAEPLNELKVEFMATQEGAGDPSPTNVRPIVGVTEINAYLESAYNASAIPKISVTLPPLGKNLWDESKTVRGKKIDDQGNIIDANGYVLSDYICVEPNARYKFSHDNMQTHSSTWAWYTGDKTFISNKSASGTDSPTAPSNAFYVRVFAQMGINEGEFQVEKNQSATAYELFKPQVGGNVSLMEGNGVGRLGYMTFDGSENWSKWASDAVFTLDVSSLAIVGASELGIPMCDRLKPVSNDGRNLYEVPRIYTHTSLRQVTIRGIDGVTTLEEFKAWLAENPVTFAYVLKNTKSTDIPQNTLQLRSGQNAIWSDAEEVTAYIPSEPTIEHVTPQPISTVEGDNTVSVTANVSNITFDAEYAVNQ